MHICVCMYVYVCMYTWMHVFQPYPNQYRIGFWLKYQATHSNQNLIHIERENWTWLHSCIFKSWIQSSFLFLDLQESQSHPTIYIFETYNPYGSKAKGWLDLHLVIQKYACVYMCIYREREGTCLTFASYQ